MRPRFLHPAAVAVAVAALGAHRVAAADPPHALVTLHMNVPAAHDSGRWGGAARGPG